MQIYSRNSENQTEKYPDVLPIIPAVVRKNDTKGEAPVTSFILDSEVVAYDKESSKLLPFQKLSTRKRKDVTVDNIAVNVIICAFDLLYLNGESLLERPLHERRALLRQHFQEVEDTFIFATYMDSNQTQHNEDEDELIKFMNKAVEGSCEGLMVKTLNDFYQPAQRSLNWLKLKKDYMNSLADSLDLVPIGAFYGKGKRTGWYGAFLLASYHESNDVFQSITKIGTGFSDEFLEKCHEFYKDKAITSKPSNVDSGLKPDVWFEPGQVWEVRAADLSISPVHRSGAGLVSASKGIALRFPRFLRIREDKQPEDATNVEQVVDMYNQQNIHTTKSDNESIY